MFSAVRLLALFVVLALTAAPAAAADPAAPLVASAYWQGFIDWWVGAVKKQNGVVMVAVAVGIVSLFIITRGKWQK